MTPLSFINFSLIYYKTITLWFIFLNLEILRINFNIYFKQTLKYGINVVSNNL